MDNVAPCELRCDIHEAQLRLINQSTAQVNLEFQALCQPLMWMLRYIMCENFDNV